MITKAEFRISGRVCLLPLQTWQTPSTGCCTVLQCWPHSFVWKLVPYCLHTSAKVVAQAWDQLFLMLTLSFLGVTLQIRTNNLSAWRHRTWQKWTPCSATDGTCERMTEWWGLSLPWDCLSQPYLCSVSGLPWLQGDLMAAPPKEKWL